MSMKAKKYDNTGKFISEMELPTEIFPEEFGRDVIHGVIRAENANRRQGTHKTKGYGEVRGGGKKPWRQKGTGYARQGSIRAPQFRKGGIVFGPVPRDYTIRVPDKMRRAGIRSILSDKAVKGSVSVVEDIRPEGYNTKKIYEILKTMGQLPGNTIALVVREEDHKLIKSVLNLPTVVLIFAHRLTVPELFYSGHLVITELALEYLKEHYKKRSKLRKETEAAS